MSTILPTTSSTRPTGVAGQIAYETDTGNLIVHDGTNWRAYNSDGLSIGASSYSLALDGTDDRVELGNLSFLNSASAFSLSAWVKISSTSTGPLFFYQSGSDTFENTIGFYQSTYIDFLVGKGPTNQYSGTRYLSNIRDDTWHHVAGVYDGSSFTFYLDGSAPTQNSIGSAVPASTRATAGNNAHIGSGTNGADEMNGYMDDFAIFDAALTSSEVSNIKENALYPASKLKHLYKFENNFNDLFGSVNGTAQADATTTTATARP